MAKKSAELQIVVDDGTREIPMRNKFGKLICKLYIRPADFSIIDRYEKMRADFDDIVKPLEKIGLKNDGTAEFEKDWATLKAVETEIKNRFNELFDMDEADEIFAKRNAFSSVGGHFFCENVLLALQGVITSAMEEEARQSNQRVEKYLPKSGVTNAGQTAENA